MEGEEEQPLNRQRVGHCRNMLKQWSMSPALPGGVVLWRVGEEGMVRTWTLEGRWDVKKGMGMDG